MTGFNLLSIEEYRARPNQYQLIDVRSVTEYAAGHIPGAMNVPLEQLQSRLPDLSESRTVALVCQSGTRAKMAADLLSHDRPNRMVLDGSTNGWSAAGHPLVRTVAARWALERQVRLGAGLIVLLAVVLSLMLDRRWMYLAGFVGLGLCFAGITNICGMGLLLAKMPWNRNWKPNSL